MGMGTLCFDLDGTLCTNTGGAYEAAEPYPWAIRRLEALVAAGHRIIILTARGSATGIDWEPLTRRQLELWGVPYDELRFGKPSADVYVDDRAVHADAWRVGDGLNAPGFGPGAPEPGERPHVPPGHASSVVEVGRTFGGRLLRVAHHAARARALACRAGIPGAPSPARIAAAVRAAVGDDPAGETVYAISIGVAGHLGFLDVVSATEPTRMHVSCRPLAEPAAGLAGLLADASGRDLAVRASIESAPGAWPLGHGADGGLYEPFGGQLASVVDGKVMLQPFHGHETVAASWLEDLAADADLDVVERPITTALLAAAEEAFIVGLPFCVLPVAAVDDRLLGEATPGPVTARLIEEWSRDAEVDLAAQLAALTGPEAALAS